MRGSGWPVFGVALLTLLILLAFSLALGIALTPLGGAARGFLQAAIGNSLAAPFAAVAWTLTYFRLRDIEDGGGGLVAAARVSGRARARLAAALATAAAVATLAACGGGSDDDAAQTAAAAAITSPTGAVCEGGRPRHAGRAPGPTPPRRRRRSTSRPPTPPPSRPRAATSSSPSTPVRPRSR